MAMQYQIPYVEGKWVIYEWAYTAGGWAQFKDFHRTYHTTVLSKLMDIKFTTRMSKLKTSHGSLVYVTMERPRDA